MEEADQRLELLLALPLGRARWLGGRVTLACLGTGALALVAGVLAWVGAAVENAGVSLPRLIGAGATRCPLRLLPRDRPSRLRRAAAASAAIAYGVVVGAFLLQLFGALVGAPHWVLDLSPFAHVAPVPGAAFRPEAAAVMVAVGAIATAGAFLSFGRRDLIGS